MCFGKLSIKSETASDTDNGCANANVARRAKCCGCESRTATRDHAVVCTGTPLNKTSERVCENKKNGVWQMLNEIIATALLIALAWFAAGSSQLAEERNQIKRGNKWARDNYPPTY